jgi:hypothetical protein
MPGSFSAAALLGGDDQPPIRRRLAGDRAAGMRHGAGSMADEREHGEQATRAVHRRIEGDEAAAE